MVKSVHEDDKILCGDSVVFRYSNAFDNGDSLIRVSGRITGKLTVECAIRTTFESDDYYLLELAAADAHKMQNEDDPIYLFAVRDGTALELEWGTKPKQPFICVKKSLLTHAVSWAAAAYKKKGLCPRCGDSGYWKALALNCNWHGQFI